MALMDHYDAYLEILNTQEDNRFEQLQVLREAREKIESGVLAVTNPDNGMVEELDVMQRY